MRRLALAILAIGTLSAAVPASAQTYDPSYPVCLHVYGRNIYYECRYTSIAQCARLGIWPRRAMPGQSLFRQCV